MNLRRTLPAACALTLLAPGLACVMPDDLGRLQTDMVDVRKRLAQIETGQAEAAQRLDELTARTEKTGEEVTREDLADALLRIDQLSRQVSASDDRVNEVAQRLDRYSGDLAQTRELARRGSGASSTTLPPAGPPGAPPTGPPADRALPDPESLYNSAYADFSKGNYALAIAGFREYQQRFPDTGSADNALYWIAECLFSQGKFRDAIAGFDGLLQRYPTSEKVPAANLKKGLAYLEQNQIKEAIVQLRYVASTYPDTDEARLARDKLAGLGPG